MRTIKLLVLMSMLNVVIVTAVASATVAVPPSVPEVAEVISSPIVQKPTPMVVKPPTANPTVAPTPATKPVGCVIQIDDVKYEISALQRTHSGGNVFTCGTDMSAIFWGRHNQKILQMMQKYRI